MEKINLDGKEYVCSQAYCDLEIKYEELKNKKEENNNNDTIYKNKFKELKVKYMDEAHVMGMGSFKPEGEWIHCKVGIKRLDNAIKSLSWLTTDKRKSGDRSISLMFAKDMPLLLGNFDEERGEGSGIIIAPRESKD